MIERQTIHDLSSTRISRIDGASQASKAGPTFIPKATRFMFWNRTQTTDFTSRHEGNSRDSARLNPVHLLPRGQMFWWVILESNQVCRKAADLQSAAVANAAHHPMFLLLLLFMVEKVGLKPTTFRLKSERSFTELLPHIKAHHRWPLCGVSRLRHWALDVL